jgi:antirestriction protein ArdC
VGASRSRLLVSLKGLGVTMSAAVKVDLYQSVTDAIVSKLEAGVSPWAPSWASAKVSRPLRSCGLPYNGVNVLILWMSALEAGYTSPYWLTYKQAEALGAQVRKGSKGVRVVYYGTFEKSETDSAGESVAKKIPFLKSYCVFNACQIDGLPSHFFPAAESLAINPGERIESVDKWAAATGATVTESGSRACYNRLLDAVNLPPFAQFESPEAFASVLAHELVHWSGHESRLNRDLGKRFGDNAYAIEELVAELGAAFCMADLGLGVVPRDDHASYLASWLSVLKADKRAIFTAASAASAAAGFLGSFSGAVSSGESEEILSESV